MAQEPNKPGKPETTGTDKAKPAKTPAPGTPPAPDEAIEWSTTTTGPDGLPLGTDAPSGPGSDGPV